MLRVVVAEHPTLALGAFVSEIPADADATPSPAWLAALLEPGASAPLASDDHVREKIRDVLRAFGYRPSGRGKPASEFLLRGVRTINRLVDVANAVSMHSGLPISVVDVERLVLGEAPLRVAVATAGEEYVFNASEQVIALAGLPCLYDATGPCANAVRDAQRTKTSASTRQTLSIVWGSRELGDRTQQTVAWYRQLLGDAGIATTDVTLS